LLRRAEGAFSAADGTALFRRSWRPAGSPSRALVVVHGYAEHSGRYEGLATWFGERGHVVHAYDHRGHGRSAGLRAHVDSLEEFVRDLDTFVELVRAEEPGLPLALVAHSMGGLIALAYLAEAPPGVLAAIVSGPALSVGAVSPLRIAAARLLRRVAPRFAMGSGLDPSGLSRDPEVVQAYLEDPLVFRTMTTSLGVELLQGAARVAHMGARLRVPLLLLHGEEDPLCAVEGSRSFHADVQSPGSALRTYPGLRHEIFNEPEREAIYGEALEWLEKLSR
jgi:alpha-beta hydrolase superfamily lysophospholipase